MDSGINDEMCPLERNKKSDSSTSGWTARQSLRLIAGSFSYLYDRLSNVMFCCLLFARQAHQLVSALTH